MTAAADMGVKFPTEVLARVKSTSFHKPQRSAIVTTRVPLWNKRVQKFFKADKNFHISDPTGAVRKGDTVAIARWPSLGSSKRIDWTVTRIVSAAAADGAGAPSSRPAVLTEAERVEWRRNSLLEKGAKSTVSGIKSGRLVVGEAGAVYRRQERTPEPALEEMVREDVTV